MLGQAGGLWSLGTTLLFLLLSLCSSHPPPVSLALCSLLHSPSPPLFTLLLLYHHTACREWGRGLLWGCKAEQQALPHEAYTAE